MNTEYFSKMDYEMQQWEEHVEDTGFEVYRRLHDIGVVDLNDQKKIANLLIAAYGDYKEADDFADYLGLEEKHILCCRNTENSLSEYKKILDDEKISYWM